MGGSRARWNMAWAWTSALDLPSVRLESAAATPAPARAEAITAGRHACKQHENGGDQCNDRGQAQRHADPVGNCSQNDRYQNSNHFLPPPWWLKRLFPARRIFEHGATGITPA